MNSTERVLTAMKSAYRQPSLERPSLVIDQTRDTEKLWLNKNENIDPILNEKIHKLLFKVPTFAINTYPETAKVYKKLSKTNQLAPESFLLTQGSDGAIRTVFDLFVSPGDKVLQTSPSFAMYSVYSKMYGAQAVTVDYEWTDKGPRLDFKNMLALIHEQRPKLVCLPNPDSPTGTVISQNQMMELLQVTEAAGSILLIDEAYFPFYETTVLPLVMQYPHLLVARSFSKAWGAAGLRVGFLAGNPTVMSLVQKNRAMYEVGTFSTEMIYLLLDLETEMRQSVKSLLEGKDFFASQLTALGFQTVECFGNFIHVNFGEADLAMSQVLSSTVLYRREFNGASCLRGLSRFSLGTKEQFQIILQKIKMTLQKETVI